MESASVVVNTTRVRVRPENRKELFQTISSLLDRVRREKGCRMYRLYEETGDENSFLLIGEWETREDWDKHFHSDLFAVLLASIIILGRRSELDFRLLSHLAGMETVTQQRTWCHR